MIWVMFGTFCAPPRFVNSTEQPMELMVMLLMECSHKNLKILWYAIGGHTCCKLSILYGMLHGNAFMEFSFRFYAVLWRKHEYQVDVHVRSLMESSKCIAPIIKLSQFLLPFDICQWGAEKQSKSSSMISCTLLQERRLLIF